MAVDLVVKNGTVVTSTGRFRGGIAIDGGVIVAVAGDEGLPSAERTIDATGLYVLPGAINPHVHFREPGLEYKEDFTTGSTAAVMGGICTVVDMPNTKPPTADPDGVMLKRRLDRGEVVLSTSASSASHPGERRPDPGHGRGGGLSATSLPRRDDRQHPGPRRRDAARRVAR